MTQIGQTYIFSGSTLTCPICTHTYFEQEQVSSDEQSEVQTEETLPQTDIFICANCGYILWFLLLDSGKQGRSYTFLDSTLQCAFCEGHEFTHYKAALNTRSASFMQFNWVRPLADTYVCTICGTILWLFTPESGRSGLAYEISGRQLTCHSCGQIQFRERETLIHSRNIASSGTDWVASSAKNYVCTLCSSMYWFA